MGDTESGQAERVRHRKRRRDEREIIEECSDRDRSGRRSEDTRRFLDRTDAGERLAEALDNRGIDATVVLAVPRGGVPLGRIVADTLDAPLDVIVARKIGAPGNAELAVGAVAADGTVWLHDRLIAELGIDDDLATAIDRQHAQARATVDRYRGDRPPLDLAGARVVVVDDGVATGATTTACLRSVRQSGADVIVLAVPVGPPDTVERLHDEADDVICVSTPRQFRAVGQWYDSFAQITDDEAISYLE